MLNRWSDRQTRKLQELDALVYATRTIGQESELVLWGGGNSSAKAVAKDHMDHDIRVLWVKGSGSDMKTITSQQFTPLRLDELLMLVERPQMTDEEMVTYQSHCMLVPNAPKPSIETLLHAFIPAPHVYHTHPDSICVLTDTSDRAKVISHVYGKEVALIPYLRPGFRLAKLVGEAYERHAALRAIILDKHGLVTWGDSPKEAYLKTISIVSEAERFIRRSFQKQTPGLHRAVVNKKRVERHDRAGLLAPILRGAISRTRRILLAYEDSKFVLSFVNDPRARMLSQIGPFTPDHLLHTKAKPLFLDLPERASKEIIQRAIGKAVRRYCEEYTRYFERYKSSGVTMLDPYPRVILIPGIGLFTTGKDRRATRIARDLYRHTIGVILNASAIDTYTSISPEEICDFEYWPLENFKLTLLPPEKTLSRRIVLITGAAGAIGRAIGAKFVAEGASVILTDVNASKLRTLSAELNSRSGEENTVALPMDVSNEYSVKKAFEKAVLAYGGLDIVVSNAGIGRSAAVDALSLKDWSQSFAVNSTGHFLVCREAMRIFKAQKLGGNIVVVASKNVLSPGKEFGAYSASKAAQAQLARVLAIEGGEYGIRVNIINPDAVLEGSGIWSKKLRQARARAYNVSVDKLDEFCVQRNLLKVKVLSEDIAEVVMFLASDRSSKTTGAMIPVDGGLREAFPR